jgi:starch synthase
VNVILSHPTGNANVRAALRGLHGAGLLARFVTTLTVAADGALVRCVPGVLRRELGKRAYPDLPPALVRQVPYREVLRLAAQRLGWAWPTRHESGWASVDAVYRGLDRTTAADIRRGRLVARAVYAYEDGAQETFRAAAERGMARFYELPIAYWRAVQVLLAEEAELQPAWAATLEGLHDSPAKLARKDAEIELADIVIVPCTYARNCLVRHQTVDAGQIRLLAYGAPGIADVQRAPNRHEEALRIVYVGQLRQRKGIAYLLQAVDRLGRAHRLTLVGSCPEVRCRPLERALERHHWVPHVPHGEAIELIRQHDVMVFPSLCEGFGLVILEAMAQGIPVITTPHTGGPDVIEDGVDGFIVPIRDPDAIADRLAWLADDPDRLTAMGEAARRKAAAWGWERYERALVALVRPWLA